MLQELPNNVNIINQNHAFLNQPPPQGNNLGVQLQGNNPDGQVVVPQVLQEPYNNENQDVQNYGPHQEGNQDGLRMVHQADGELLRNQNVLPVGANAARQHVVHEALEQRVQNQHQDQAPNLQGGKQDENGQGL